MLSSHNFRTLNPSMSQTPLCQTIKTTIPPTAICSKTTKIRKFLWVDSHQDITNNYDHMVADHANSIFLETGNLPLNIETKTDLVDPFLKHMTIPINETDGLQDISITPALSSGLLHELYLRESENPKIILTQQQIEAVPSRYASHGQLIAEQKGVLKSLLLPKLNKQFESFLDEADDEHLILEFDISQFNVSIGFVGIGLPPLTMIGLFVSNYLEKELEDCTALSFAIGFKEINFNHTRLYLCARSTAQNDYRYADLKICMVFKTDKKSDLVKVFERLNGEFKINGTSLYNKNVRFSNNIPNYYWLKGMESEVAQIMEQKNTDALGVAFLLSETKRLSVPIAVGFVILDDPKPIEYFDFVRYPHAWAEPIFRSVELVLQKFSNDLFFKKDYCRDNRIIEWKQNFKAYEFPQ